MGNQKAKVRLVTPFSWARGNQRLDHTDFLTSITGVTITSNVILRFLVTMSILIPINRLRIMNLLTIIRETDPFARPSESKDSKLLIRVGYFQNYDSVALSGTASKIASRLSYYDASRSNVCIHVRGGDYLKAPGLFGRLGRQYYKDATKSLGPSCEASVITNDEVYARDLLEPILNIRFSKKSVIEDFTFAVSSDFFVGSNSTFSWWIAYVRLEMGLPSVLPEPFFPEWSTLKPGNRLVIPGVVGADPFFD